MKRIIGLTGGVGSGKSTVLALLRDSYGALVLEADRIGHEVMEPGEICYDQVVGRFGKKILRPDGSIDRSVLAGIVFTDEAALESLNAIIHPAVRFRIRERIREAEEELIVVEAALLLEDHYDEFLDEIWVVDVPEEERIRRLMLSRGYSYARCRAVIDSQLSREEFLSRADAVIDNSGSVEETRRQIERLLGKRETE